MNERGCLLDVREADVRRELERLRSQVADLRASRLRLVLADDAERRGIERILHEGVQQLLVTLAANIELADASVNADPAAARKLLEEMRRDAQEVLEETRKLADRIYPTLLEAGGLRAALRSAAASAGLPVRLHVDVSGACPPEIAGTAYRVYLDVLDRVDAGTPVVVSIQGTEEHLSFEIVADGNVDADLPSRDRVEALDGRLTIRREPGHQTRVVGFLPLSG